MINYEESRPCTGFRCSATYTSCIHVQVRFFKLQMLYLFISSSSYYTFAPKSVLATPPWKQVWLTWNFNTVTQCAEWSQSAFQPFSDMWPKIQKLEPFYIFQPDTPSVRDVELSCCKHWEQAQSISFTGGDANTLKRHRWPRAVAGGRMPCCSVLGNHAVYSADTCLLIRNCRI